MYKRGLLAVLLAGTTLAGQQAPDDKTGATPGHELESFSVASYELGSWLIIDVRPVQPGGSKVRFMHVHPGCGSFRVHEIDHVFDDASVQQLAKDADLCAPEQTVTGITNLFKAKDADPSPEMAQGIEAQCGTEKIVHHLPAAYWLRLASMKAKAPRVAALWDVSEEIRRLYTKETGRSLSRDSHSGGWLDSGLEAHELAEQAAIELRNGSYDLVTPVPNDRWTGGRTKLSELVPEFREATPLEENFAVVPNLDHLGLEKYSRIPYPMMAVLAQIDGAVNLELSIDSDTGLVSGVAGSSGHPLLQQGAVEATKQWVFTHPYLGLNPLHLDVHFEMHCPTTISSTYRILD